jgi:hypothetical protein
MYISPLTRYVHIIDVYVFGLHRGEKKIRPVLPAVLRDDVDERGFGFEIMIMSIMFSLMKVTWPRQ